MEKTVVGPFKVLEFDKPTKNGRIYRQQFTILPYIFMNCYLDHGRQQDMLCGKADADLHEDGVYIDFEPIGENGQLALDLLKSGFVFRTGGPGNVDDDGNVSDFELKYVFLTNDPA
jgi:hypothetical protein